MSRMLFPQTKLQRKWPDKGGQPQTKTKLKGNRWKRTFVF